MLPNAFLTKPGLASDQRGRESMDDRFVIGEVPGGALYAVFDGHGGVRVADHACATVLTSTSRAFSRSTSPESWRSVFSTLDFNVTGCGSTATVMICLPDNISIAWVGDSRALLVRSSGHRILTRAHRADRGDERERVLSAGAELRGPY